MMIDFSKKKVTLVKVVAFKGEIKNLFMLVKELFHNIKPLVYFLLSEIKQRTSCLRRINTWGLIEDILRFK